MNKWVVGFITGLTAFIGVLWYFQAKKRMQEELNYAYGDSLYQGEEESYVKKEDIPEEETGEIKAEELEEPPYTALVH